MSIPFYFLQSCVYTYSCIHIYINTEQMMSEHTHYIHVFLLLILFLCLTINMSGVCTYTYMHTYIHWFKINIKLYIIQRHLGGWFPPWWATPRHFIVLFYAVKVAQVFRFVFPRTPKMVSSLFHKRHVAPSNEYKKQEKKHCVDLSSRDAAIWLMVVAA